MGQHRSPHKRRKPPALPKFEGRPHFYGRGYTVPFGKKTRTAHSNGLKPGDTFVDPQGKKHVVPDKRRRKSVEKKTRGAGA